MSTDIAFAMDALVDYYGDGASLDELQAAEIRSYLLENGADRARAFAVGSDARDVLPRITTMRYFRREHSEIPTRVVRGSA